MSSTSEEMSSVCDSLTGVQIELGVTTEYPAFLEATPKKRWIRGYAVKLDLPSP